SCSRRASTASGVALMPRMKRAGSPGSRSSVAKVMAAATSSVAASPRNLMSAYLIMLARAIDEAPGPSARPPHLPLGHLVLDRRRAARPGASAPCASPLIGEEPVPAQAGLAEPDEGAFRPRRSPQRHSTQ